MPVAAAPTGITMTFKRVIEATPSDVFRAFNDPTRRGWCLTPGYKVRSHVAPRALSLGMPDGAMVVIGIARLGNVRCAVDVTQRGLTDADAVARARAEWRDALARMAEVLGD